MNVVRGLTENRIFRFLVTGALNTIMTFGIYVALKTVFDYQIAYFLSYVSGIVFAYLMNALFVFKKRVSLRSFIRFPLVYVVQYIAGAFLLELLVQVLGLSVTFAPLFVIVLTLPLTFLLSRFVLLKY
jgi:putative flippase GtrA